MSTVTHQNLLAGQAPETRLPADPAAAELAAPDGPARFGEIVRSHPESSLCWAMLAESALAINNPDGDVAAYAYARTGYHRGLDALRRSGWKGSGPVPWEHEPNRGFLRALAALAGAAERLGETSEFERCIQFLRDSSESAWQHLAGPDRASARSLDDAHDDSGEGEGPTVVTMRTTSPQQQGVVIEVIPPAMQPAEAAPAQELQSATEQ